ncbi:stage III sporulation protein AG [Anaerobacillus sp. MEB173]|uniref:stage III sporulation protein AG n=1 Tax=Anaerobacillus sp. MEB173 TaxID=3383345 RepID=UPI003F92273B
MDKEEKNHKQWLTKLFQKKEEGKGKIKSIHYLALVLCIGVALMILGNFFTNESGSNQVAMPVFKDDTSPDSEPVFGNKAQAEPYSMEDYEHRYENQLREVLEEIIGVSDVSVMINLAETEKQVYEKDQNTKKQNTDETDREGGKRKVEDVTRDEKVVIIRNGDSEKPLIVKTEKPAVRGVVVVARGVDNIQVKTMVVEAVSRVLDVPTHRVSVLPKKLKGEE